ncbi:MAG: hypothetical protein QOF39_3338 [Frankiales bacterium]|nr:hypothetical protein [Frankiales bacterium]
MQRASPSSNDDCGQILPPLDQLDERCLPERGGKFCRRGHGRPPGLHLGSARPLDNPPLERTLATIQRTVVDIVEAGLFQLRRDGSELRHLCRQYRVTRRLNRSDQQASGAPTLCPGEDATRAAALECKVKTGFGQIMCPSRRPHLQFGRSHGGEVLLVNPQPCQQGTGRAGIVTLRKPTKGERIPGTHPLPGRAGFGRPGRHPQQLRSNWAPCGHVPLCHQQRHISGDDGPSCGTQGGRNLSSLRPDGCSRVGDRSSQYRVSRQQGEARTPLSLERSQGLRCRLVRLVCLARRHQSLCQ